jgi:uncharacterized protein
VSASAIYEGSVRHRRLAVRDCEFRHRLALLYLDLDELPGLLGGYLLRHSPGLVRFRRRDYLGDPTQPLADAVRDALREQTGVAPHGPIRLLTQPRTLGHCFNPVSFYYCFDATADRVQGAIAEVTNTPWGERHAYALAAPSEEAVIAGGAPKALHVSPFMGMDHSYEWRLTTPAETLSVHIASRREGRLVFDATLALRRRALTRASLARLVARYPFASLRVLALIYAHAAALKLRGVPIHPHPRAT